MSALEEYQLAKEMFNECVLSETADAAIAELEAENVRQKATIEAQSAIIKQADEALAARERMLRLAWTETVQAESYYWKYHDNVDEWLADLRARAEEGSRDE